MNKIPSRADWGDIEQDWNVSDAFNKFFGKTLEEAILIFQGSSLSAAEDLSYMPVTPFQYYIQAFAAFLTSPIQGDDVDGELTDGANAFLSLLKRRLQEAPHSIMPVMNSLLPVAQYIAHNQNLLQADEDIYGSFKDRFAEIQLLYENAIQNSKE